MRFDYVTVVLLELRPDAPKLDPAAGEALQNAHLAHLADLHDSGALLAAGPLLGEPARAFQGLTLFATDVETAVAFSERDPAVVAGRFRILAQPWAVPHGAMSFAHTRLPRSMADVDD